MLSICAFTSCGSGDRKNAGLVDSFFEEEAEVVIPPTPAAETDFTSPLPGLKAPLYLSGNFAELRNNHFHSGVDFKTSGRTGFKVVAVDSGYVSRISVSPWGFGRAVYVDHPHTGLTTVYGHLDAFSPEIDSRVRDEQYRLEIFTIDMNFKPGEIPVSRGETIGISGNAGSSGGPHLHLDVRHTSSEDPLDPIPYFKKYISDKAKPEMRKLALYPVEGEGTVSGTSSYLPGKASYRFTAWGKVYPGIKAYDRMTDTHNIYGVKYLSLTVDGDTVYRRTLDRFSFADTRAVHTLIHNPSLKKGGEWIMVTKVPEGSPLDAMIEAENHGIIDIYEEKDYACKFILRDEFGNTNTIPFTITGRKSAIRKAEYDEKVYPFDSEQIIKADGITVKIPAYARYESAPMKVVRTESSDYLSGIFTIGDYTEALHKALEIEIPVLSETPEKITLVRLSDKGKGRSAVDSEYKHGRVKAKIKNPGRYALTYDTIAPTIKKISQLKYRISDNLSGIATSRGEIDGKFALFELDGKTATLSFKIDKKRFPSTGKAHKILISVTDAAGNSAQFSDSAVW